MKLTLIGNFPLRFSSVCALEHPWSSCAQLTNRIARQAGTDVNGAEMGNDRVSTVWALRNPGTIARRLPNCDISRAGSGRPLHPTADLGTLSVQGQKSGGPDPLRTRSATPRGSKATA